MKRLAIFLWLLMSACAFAHVPRGIPFPQFDPAKRLTGAAPVKVTRPHETFSYGYDAANNLAYRTKNVFAQTYSSDAANQLSTISRSNSYTASGLVTTSACAVAINGNAAVLYPDNTYALAGFQLLDGTNIFVAIAQDALGRRDTNMVTIFAPTNTTLTYDLNGNLRYDGTRAFD